MTDIIVKILLFERITPIFSFLYGIFLSISICAILNASYSHERNSYCISGVVGDVGIEQHRLIRV